MTTKLPPASIDDVESYLHQFDNQFALQVLPAILVLSLLILVGVVGNSLVCYIYICRFKKSTTRCFILALALFDLINCFIGIPVEIIDMRYNYTYGFNVVCGFSRMFVVFTSIGSGSVLVAVAVDRYKQICKTFQPQTTIKMSKLAVVLCSLAALVVALPASVIYGGRTVMTSNMNINGSDCSTADRFIGTPYPLVYNGVQFLIFLSATLTLVVLYSFIWKQVRRQQVFRASFSVHKGANKSSPEKCSNSKDESLSSDAFHDNCVSTDSSYISQVDKKAHFSKEKDKDTKTEGITKSRRSRIEKGVRKTTFMLFLITLVFVLSYLPHLGLMAARAVHKSMFENLQGGKLAAYNLFLRSYFFNSASNPIIYSLCNGHFRRELKLLMKRISCRK